VRSLISDEYELNIKAMQEANTYAWKGGQSLASSSDFDDLIVTKKMYEEHGHSICIKKFNIDNE